jgi:GNAT superfamily N-acetyltransferase
VAAGCGPIRCELGPLDSFLPDNPVLFLSVGGEVDAVLALRSAVFTGALQRDLAWPFVPHVTLADDAPVEVIEAARVALAGYRVSVTFDRVHLLEEQRDDQDRRVWRPVADFAFRRPAVVGRGGVEVEITESGEPDPEVRAWVDREWDRIGEDRFDGEAWDERPFTLVARSEGRIVGAAVGWTNLGVGYLGELMVGTGLRGMGIGSRLLAAVDDLMRRLGVERLALRTEAGGSARALYEARGWRVEAQFEDWWGARTWVQMRRDL